MNPRVPGFRRVPTTPSSRESKDYKDFKIDKGYKWLQGFREDQGFEDSEDSAFGYETIPFPKRGSST